MSNIATNNTNQAGQKAPIETKTTFVPLGRIASYTHEFKNLGTQDKAKKSSSSSSNEGWEEVKVNLPSLQEREVDLPSMPVLVIPETKVTKVDAPQPGITEEVQEEEKLSEASEEVIEQEAIEQPVQSTSYSMYFMKALLLLLPAFIAANLIYLNQRSEVFVL